MSLLLQAGRLEGVRVCVCVCVCARVCARTLCEHVIAANRPDKERSGNTVIGWILCLTETAGFSMPKGLGLEYGFKMKGEGFSWWSSG